MSMKKASDFHPEVLKIFDRYVHGIIDRRAFLQEAAQFTAKGVTAMMLLDALSPRFAEAQQISPSDPRITTSRLDYASPQGSGSVKGYLAKPAKTSGPLPIILVIHENRGLNPHIEDIARRLALDNFIAFAPDALTVLGGYPGDEDKARALFGTLDQAKAREDFIAGAKFLESLPGGNGKLGAVGFCYGGSITNFLATRLPELKAAVPFYGSQPTAEETAQIKAKLLIQYADNDDRVNEGWPAYEAALKASHVAYEMFRYPGTQHGFNNDTTPRYDQAAASLAWQRTIAFFNQILRS